VGCRPRRVAMTIFHFTFYFLLSLEFGRRKMNQEMDLLYCSLARSWAKVEPLIQIKHGLRFFFFFFFGFSKSPSFKSPNPQLSKQNNIYK
jgi:hypothetical protein